MKRDLFLFPDADGPGAGDAGLAWARVDGPAGAVTTGWAENAQGLPKRGATDRVVLLAPGEDVAVHMIDLPARTEAQARAAAGFAVEDLVAEPLDEVHVIAGPRPALGGARAIGVIARPRFAAWRATLDAFVVTPDHILPDTLATPLDPDAVTILDLGARVLVRGPALAFAVEEALAREVIDASLADADVAALRIESDRPDALVGPGSRAGRSVDVAPAPNDAALAHRFQRGLDGPLPLDLATADAAPDAGLAFDARRWRLAAGLALAAGLGYAALLVTQITALDRATDAAYAEAEEVLRAAAPDIGRVVNPRAQLRARLAEAGGDGQAFVALSGLVADSVRGIASLEVDAIRYDAARTELAVAIRYAAYEDVERLKAAVDARGGLLEEGGSRRVGALMGGDVVVRAQP